MSSHLYIDVRMQNHSGIGTYIRNTVGRLMPRFPAGSYTLLGPKGGNAMTAPAGGFKEFTAPIYSIKEQLAAPGFGIGRDDLMWTPHYNMPLFLGCRKLVNVHDLLHLAMPEFAGGFAKQTYAKIMFSQVASRAEKIISGSQFAADELKRFTGVSSKKVIVILDAVDPFWKEPATLAPPLDGPYFLFVGNVKPHKNLRRLIAAIRIFSEEFPHHRLVIVGKREGFIRGDTEAIREAESMPGKVVFTGYIEDPVLKAYFQGAQALIFPSLYEGFGLPPLEAMSSGCPVVASDIKVHREVCGSAAVFCDPHSVPDIVDKMRLVAKFSASQKADVIAAGRVQAQKFSWDQCADETYAVIQEILTGKRG